MAAPKEDWQQERARVLAQARVVVVKVGSAVLTDANGLSLPVLENLAGQLALAKAQGELAKEGDIPTLTAFLQVHIQGLVTFAQCHPDRPLLAGVVARMMSALRA